MDKRFRKAFDQIQADYALKTGIRSFLYQEQMKRMHAGRVMRRVGAAAACLVLGITVWMYLTPTAEISIDINPSVELEVNRFDQVISAEGMNPEGVQLEESLQLCFISYEEAINRILDSEQITALLAEEERMTIAVIGPENAQTSRMLSDMEHCTNGKDQILCYSARKEEVQSAHELGISYGKYRVYLELQKKYPELTPQEVQNMKMSDLMDLLGADDMQEIYHEGVQSGEKRGAEFGKKKGLQE